MEVTKTTSILNPHKKQLTVEVLRTFPGCENIPDAEAEEIVSGLIVLANIIVEFEKQDHVQYTDI